MAGEEPAPRFVGSRIAEKSDPVIAGPHALDRLAPGLWLGRICREKSELRSPEQIIMLHDRSHLEVALARCRSAQERMHLAPAAVIEIAHAQADARHVGDRQVAPLRALPRVERKNDRPTLLIGEARQEG